MHVVIRNYTASPEVITETKRNMEHLEETMRGIPGFVAYYFIETDDGLATVTVTEDKTGTAESMGRAASWIEQHTPNHTHQERPRSSRGTRSSAPPGSTGSSWPES